MIYRWRDLRDTQPAPRVQSRQFFLGHVRLAMMDKQDTRISFPTG